MTALSDTTREALLTAFRRGEYPDGRLPPEAQLAVRLNVSRGTLRAALQSLEAEGLISRRRRRGTFVNAHVLRSSMQLNRLVPFAQLIEQSGYAASTDPVRQLVGHADDDAARELAIDPGAPTLSVTRLLRADGHPVISVTDLIALERLTVAPAAVRPGETTFEFLERNTAARVDYATSELIPRVATATAPEGLGLEPGTPYLQLREVVFSPEHERVALSVICVKDRYVRLSLLRRGR